MLAQQFAIKLIQPDVEMEVLPVLMNVELIDMSPTQIDLQMNIKHPDAVSSIFGQPHKVELVLNENAFIDPMLKSIIDTKYLFKLDSPRMSDKEFTENVKETVEIAADTGSYAS